MSREYCMIMEEIRGQFYCGFYDFACRLCSEIKDCPDGLDDDEIDEDYNNDDEYYEDNSDFE